MQYNVIGNIPGSWPCYGSSNLSAAILSYLHKNVGILNKLYIPT